MKTIAFDMFENLTRILYSISPSATIEEIEFFLGISEYRILSRGSFLQTYPMVLSKVVFVETGALRVFEYHDGWERVQHLLSGGDMYFDYESLNERYSSATVQALKPATVIVADYHEILKQASTSYLAQDVLMKLAATSVTAIVDQRRMLSGLDARDRIDQFVSNKPDWFENFSQKDVSSYLGLAAESFSRIYNKAS